MRDAYNCRHYRLSCALWQEFLPQSSLDGTKNMELLTFSNCTYDGIVARVEAADDDTVHLTFREGGGMDMKLQIERTETRSPFVCLWFVVCGLCWFVFMRSCLCV